MREFAFLRYIPEPLRRQVAAISYTPLVTPIGASPVPMSERYSCVLGDLVVASGRYCSGGDPCPRSLCRRPCADEFLAWLLATYPESRDAERAGLRAEIAAFIVAFDSGTFSAPDALGKALGIFPQAV